MVNPPNRRYRISILANFGLFAVCVGVPAQQHVATSSTTNFGEVVQAVRPRYPLIILSRGDAVIAVAPRLQGRVLTSSADGRAGRSLGWVNVDLLTSGKVMDHFNPYGGEDRIWLGPEGGQFGLFFAPNQPFDLDHWYTPAALDTGSFDVIARSTTSVELQKEFSVSNRAGTVFNVRINRRVSVLSTSQVWKDLGHQPIAGPRVVGYESENKLTNEGTAAWRRDTGLLSVWILGQFNASPKTTVILPIRPGPEAHYGAPVRSDYFGVVPANRLAITSKAIFFRADARSRGKIGLSPERATGLLGSYDRVNRVLTVIQYTAPKSRQDYVNSSWQIQTDPYIGDVVNSYNDGVSGPENTRLGDFYEMETSSPAAQISPNQSIVHVHRTVHFEGTETQLGKICEAILGVSLPSLFDRPLN